MSAVHKVNKTVAPAKQCLSLPMVARKCPRKRQMLFCWCYFTMGQRVQKRCIGGKSHSLAPLTPQCSTPLHSAALHSTPLCSNALPSTMLHATPLHAAPLGGSFMSEQVAMYSWVACVNLTQIQPIGHCWVDLLQCLNYDFSRNDKHFASACHF